MSWPLIFFVVLLVATLGSFPVWPHSRAWGFMPTGVLVLLTVLVGLKAFNVI